MKKILIALFMFNLFTIISYASELSLKIVWENTTVRIPLGGDIEEYSLIPKASIYVNGVLTETDVYYDRNANYTSLDEFTSSIPGTHIVFYEATFPKYNIAEMTEITCIVYDNTFPEFNIPEDIYIIYGEKYDFDTIVCSDEYDGILEYNYVGEVDYSKIGDYEIVFIACDSSGNKTRYKVTFHIVDEVSPKIEILNNIIEYGDFRHDFLNDVLVTDNIDNNLIPLVIQEIDFYRVGSYEVIFYVYDSSGNYSYIKEMFYVCDFVAPKISLKADLIKVKRDEAIDYRSYINYVFDNSCSLNVDDVVIDTNFKNEVGNYKVNYYLKDDYGNIGYNCLNIKVLDEEYPIIYASNSTLKKLEEFDPLKNVTAFDNLDGDITYRISYDDNVDTTKTGVYEVNYYVYDSSGNYTNKKVYVNVYSDSRPISFPDNTYEENQNIDSVEINQETTKKNSKFKLYYLIVPLFILVGLIIIFIRRKKK